MFNRIKTELIRLENLESSNQKISGVGIYDYLDELQNSPVFRNSEIEIVLSRGVTRLKIWTTPVTKWTRFSGKIYLYSICLSVYSSWNGDDRFYISGNFDDRKISHDKETALRLDRLYELNKLDI